MSKRILVIDDDLGIRRSFSLTLGDAGYRVDTAESGEKAIGMPQGHPYDLVYLDLKMPGMNGVETLRELRKMDKEVPIYIITAFHAEFLDQLESATEDRIDFELLKKPIGSRQLTDVTRGILEGPVAY